MRELREAARQHVSAAQTMTAAPAGAPARKTTTPPAMATRLNIDEASAGVV